MLDLFGLLTLALFDQLHFFFLALFQLFDQTFCRNNIRVLLGILQKQRVQMLVQGLDALVDFRRGSRAGNGDVVDDDVGFVAGDLVLESVARLLGFLQLQPRLVEAIGNFRELRGEVPVVTGHDAHVLLLECLEGGFGGEEFFFVVLDLIVDKTNG